MTTFFYGKKFAELNLVLESCFPRIQKFWNNTLAANFVYGWVSFLKLCIMSDSAILWTAAYQASLSFIISQSLLKLMAIELVMPFYPLPVNIQSWYLLELTGLVSLLSSGLSRVFFSTRVQKYQLFGTQFFFFFFMVQISIIFLNKQSLCFHSLIYICSP